MAPGSVRVEHGRLPDAVETSSESRIDARLGHVAAVLSRYGVEVWCWSPKDWKERTAEAARLGVDGLGPWGAYTAGNPRMIHLSPEVCAELTTLAEERGPLPRDDFDALAWSLAALAHESQHVAGHVNEAEAECYGAQSIQALARLLGRTAGEGRYLATVYWRHWHVWLRPSYRSPECRNDGRLDRHPQTDVWP